MQEVTLIVAFIGGVVSFVSPCVLPILPGFLSYLAGTTLKDAEAHRGRLVLNAAFFVLGFSAIFAILGVLLNSILSAVAYEAQTWLARIGGAIIILFGLFLVGLLKIPFLQRDFKVQVKQRFTSQYLTSFVFGAAFAVGWTPCVSAALGAILALAATQPGTTFALLFAYSLGLGIPFLVVALFTAQTTRFIQRYARFFHVLSVLFGILLIALGVLVFTQNLNLVANFELLNRFLLP